MIEKATGEYIGSVNYISLTDLAKYQNSSDPSFTVKN